MYSNLRFLYSGLTKSFHCFNKNYFKLSKALRFDDNGLPKPSQRSNDRLPTSVVVRVHSPRHPKMSKMSTVAPVYFQRRKFLFAWTHCAAKIKSSTGSTVSRHAPKRRKKGHVAYGAKMAKNGPSQATRSQAGQ